MKIAIDLDGVTWEVHEHLLEIYNRKYNTTFIIEDVTEWNFLPEDRFWEVYEEMTKRIMEYKPVDENIGLYINSLHNFYNVSFLTHGKYTKEVIEKKLKTWHIFKDLSYEQIIIDDYNISKTTHDFDYFIDDNPSMIKEIQDYPNKILLLFTTPWNKQENVSKYKNIYRVNNWREIINYFIFLLYRED